MLLDTTPYNNIDRPSSTTRAHRGASKEAHASNLSCYKHLGANFPKFINKEHNVYNFINNLIEYRLGAKICLLLK